MKKFALVDYTPPPPPSPPAAGTKLYVGNLPRSVDCRQLTEFFQDAGNRAGNVECIEVIYDTETHKSKGFAFVTMSTMEDSQRAIASLDGSTLDDRVVKVNFPNSVDLEKGFQRVKDFGFLEKRFQQVKEFFFGDSAGDKLYVGNLPQHSTRLADLFDEVGCYAGINLYVGNLPQGLHSGRLADLFKGVGNVDSKNLELVMIIYDTEAKKRRGFGIVTITTVADCERAIKMLDGYNLDGRFLKVNFANPVDWNLLKQAYAPFEHEAYLYDVRMTAEAWYEDTVENLSQSVDVEKLTELVTEFIMSNLASTGKIYPSEGISQMWKAQHPVGFSLSFVFIVGTLGFLVGYIMKP